MTLIIKSVSSGPESQSCPKVSRVWVAQTELTSFSFWSVGKVSRLQSLAVGGWQAGPGFESHSFPCEFGQTVAAQDPFPS